MRVVLAEEYPIERNLETLSLVNFPVDVVVAAHSPEEFEKIEELVKQYVSQVGYWPIIPRTYWASPYSDLSDIQRTINELEQFEREKSLPVVWDAEPPTTPLLLRFRYIADHWPRPSTFEETRELIRDFVANPPGSIDIYTAELPRFIVPEDILIDLGLAFEPGKHTPAIMAYTSFIHLLPRETLRRRFNFDADKYIAEKTKKEAERGIERYGRDRFALGIGCTARGKLRFEPIMTLGEFERDVGIAYEAGVQTLAVYRLGGYKTEKKGEKKKGGLTREHMEVLKQYAT